MEKVIICIYLLAIACSFVYAEWTPELLNLPDSHMTRYLNALEDQAGECRNSVDCVFKTILSSKLCWGYEHDCPNHLGIHIAIIYTYL